MIKLAFCLAFVSMVFGEEYPGFVKAVGKDRLYFVSKDKLTFGQSYATCKVNGWTLATELKAEDSKVVNDVLIKAKRQEKDFWIGAYLYENEGHPLWIWYDRGAVVEYTNWVGDQTPLDAKKSCILKTTEAGANSGKWNAAGCLEKHNYVCLVE